MSGFAGATNDSPAFTEFGVTGGLGSILTNLLLCEDISPGSPASYQICKTIFAAHPLGSKMVDVPIRMAQSQPRDISIPGAPERLVKLFQDEWKSVGAVGADQLIANTVCTARIYGISSVICGNRGGDMSQPLPMDKLHELDLYFNVMDPLNTAGSLVLDQDPNSPDFQKPRAVRVGNITYHPSRSVVIMNEQPIYIEYSASAFGYVGRSVYQRALYPMKTFLQTMVTDQWVTQKVGLLVWKAKAPGSVINQRIQAFFGFKRQQIKAGVTGNVLTIGMEDDISSLNFQNLEGPAAFARQNSLKNTAMAAGMPAVLLEQEALVEGFGEGTEDAKQIARYIDGVRIGMAPVYSFFDAIVQRRAWSPDAYKTIQRDYPEYRNVPYETAFYQWSQAFTATWPNLLSEPESEKVKTEQVRFDSVVKLVESLAPMCDPENRAKLVMWASEEINSRRELFSAPLVLDEDLLAAYVPPVPMQEETTEPKPEMQDAA